MLKKKCISMLAVILAVTMLMEMMPASGVKAVAQVAQKVFVTILEPTLVYEDVYGFFNGYARVQTKDDKVGLIDTTGKEVIPCGKYKNVNVSKGFDGMVVLDNNNHAYIMDYNQNVKVDLGTCDYAYTYRVFDPLANKYVIGARVENNSSYKTYRADGSLIEEGSYTNNNDYEKYKAILDELIETGRFSEATMFNNNGKYYYLCTIKNEDEELDELHNYVLMDSDKNEIFYKENMSSYYNIGQGFLVFGTERKTIEADDSEVYETVNEIVNYSGDTIVDNSKAFSDVISNYMSDTIIVHFDKDECWKEYDKAGNVINTYDNYDEIKAIYEKGYLIASNNILDDDGEIIKKHYYVINNNNHTVADIGEYSNISYDYVGESIRLMIGIDSNERYKPGYKIVDLNGETVFDSSKYSTFDIVFCSGEYVHAANKKIVSGKFKYYSKYIIYKADGSVLFDAGECTDAYIYNDKIYVAREDKSTEEYDMNGKLICVYDYSKYMMYGYEYDGYIPVKGIDEKWGIVRSISNPALNPPTPTPSAVPSQVQTPIDNNTSSVVEAPSKVKTYKLVAGKKKVTINLPKLKAGVKGYKVEFSLNKKFKKSNSVVVSKTKAVIKKLKSGKIYYVRVKAYTLNGKKKVFSKKWSVVKKVKVK